VKQAILDGATILAMNFVFTMSLVPFALADGGGERSAWSAPVYVGPYLTSTDFGCIGLNVSNRPVFLESINKIGENKFGQFFLGGGGGGEASYIQPGETVHVSGPLPDPGSPNTPGVIWCYLTYKGQKGAIRGTLYLRNPDGHARTMMHFE